MPLGWNIAVVRQRNDGTSPATFGALHGARLAVWQTGVSGLDWIDALVEEKRAILLGGNGYPLEYTAQACHLLPILEGDPPQAKPIWTRDPGDFILPGYLGRTTKYPEAILACRSDEWLIVQAWDES